MTRNAATLASMLAGDQRDGNVMDALQSIGETLHREAGRTGYSVEQEQEAARCAVSPAARLRFDLEEAGHYPGSPSAWVAFAEEHMGSAEYRGWYDHAAEYGAERAAELIAETAALGAAVPASVWDALQQLEELGGPEGEEYEGAMLAIAAEAIERVRTARAIRTTTETGV